MTAISAFSRKVDAFKLGLQGSRAQVMAKAARLSFADAQAQNRAVLGRDPPFRQFVDGRENAPLESVKPGGNIIYTFGVGAALLTEAVDDAIAEFMRLAPVGRAPKDKHPGLYRESLVMLVNGEQRDAATQGSAVELKDADEVSLTDLQPYSRKIEINGESYHVPNGVFQALVQVLRRRYGDVLNIRFSFEAYPGFAIGRGSAGTATQVKRASRYPTIRMSVK